MGGNNNLKVLLGILALLVAVTVAWFVAARLGRETPEQLARMALEGPDTAAQEQAAVRLEALVSGLPGTGTRNVGRPFLLKVFTDSSHPGVRAAAVRGLASIWDYDLMPEMLDLLADDSVQLRSAAGAAVEALLSAEHSFNAGDPPDQREAAAVRLRQMWKTFSATALPAWLERLEEQEKKP